MPDSDSLNAEQNARDEGSDASATDLEADASLATIPLITTGPDFALATLKLESDRAHALFDVATKGIPKSALRLADRVSRRWLAKWDQVHLAEIDAVAAMMGRPGTYFLTVNYEWGCTCAAKPAPDGDSARLIRVLDWKTHGLGRYIMAVKVKGDARHGAGDYVTLTWPGYTGVLQAMAPGRFAGALNQAPMRKTAGVMPLDWAANKIRVWGMPHATPAHLLRHVYETAADFKEARRALMETPVSSPAIFTLAGTRPDETCVIERKETEARLHTGCACAANHWRDADWEGAQRGRARGVESEHRAALMADVAADMDASFPWLSAPIRNDRTRLVMMADAKAGRLIAQGFEDGCAATKVLKLTLA